jgi:hypothetical protein
MEGNDVVDVQDAADNDFVFGIEDHACGVALVYHGIDHVLIPILSMNSRTATTR